MALATPLSSEAPSTGPSASPRFGHFTLKLGRELELADFRSGNWFPRLLALYLRHYEAHAMHEPVRARGARAETTESIIQRACAEAALAGTVTATVSTGASVYASDTGGAGLLVAVPAAMLAIGGEALLRALIHLRMTCDLASAYGVRLHPEDPADLARLYALVFGTERHASEDSGLGLLERLVSSEAEDLGEKLGTKLMGEGLARNVLPFAAVLTSPISSWKRTRHLGETMLGYVRFRRALADAFSAVLRQYPQGTELLVESAWFLLNAEGWLDEDKAALLSHLLRRLPARARRELMARLAEGESEWLRRLRHVPASVRAPFLQALVVLSAADTVTSPEQWRTLEHAARTLGRSLDRGRHKALMRRFAEEGVVPMQSLTFPTAKKRARPTPRREHAGAPGALHH